MSHFKPADMEAVRLYRQATGQGLLESARTVRRQRALAAIEACRYETDQQRTIHTLLDVVEYLIR